ncbi:MAG: hypothetical protein JWR59_1228 [Brevundimonas sp.]|nr:hypothetical protein [Brevundimonas sp.]
MMGTEETMIAAPPSSAPPMIMGENDESPPKDAVEEIAGGSMGLDVFPEWRRLWGSPRSVDDVLAHPLSDAFTIALLYFGSFCGVPALLVWAIGKAGVVQGRGVSGGVLQRRSAVRRIIGHAGARFHRRRPVHPLEHLHREIGIAAVGMNLGGRIAGETTQLELRAKGFA